MILKSDELMKAVKEFVGDDTSEDTLSFVENITDTFNDLNSRATDDVVPRTELQRVEEEWKKKYRDRFFEPQQQPNGNNNGKQREEDDDKPLTYENLFKE